MSIHYTQTPPPLARWIVAVAFFMQMLDGTILNTALPTIAIDLNEPALNMQMAVIAYMLTTALLIPSSGWLADRFGSRCVFISAIFLFTLGSLLCALSPTLEFLVFSRVVQGIGGALMVPVGRLTIIRIYPKHLMVQVLSFITIPGLIGPLLGPMVGGFLSQYVSWHWIFLINVPIGLAGIVLAYQNLPNLTEDHIFHFDLKGFALFSSAMVLLTFGMEGLGGIHLSRLHILGLCVSGIVLLALYWFHAVRVEHPLFEIQIFKTKSFSIGILGNIFARLSSGGIPFLMPLFLQLGLGFSPLHAGFTMFPIALAGMAGKSVISWLVKQMGFRTFLTLNTFLIGVLIASFSTITPDRPYILLLLHLGVFGFINSMQFTAMNSVTLIDLDDTSMGNGNTLLSVTMQISATCGVAVSAALLNMFSGTSFTQPTHVLSLDIFFWTFLSIGFFAIISSFVFFRLPSDTGTKDEQQKIIPVK